jgi:diguanylate cyclase (GGDEF)-like protein
VILVGSFFSLHQLIKRLSPGQIRRWWSLMGFFTLLFIIGYIGYAVIFWYQHNSWIDLIVPVMFFAGACFVWLAFGLSLQAAIDMRRVNLLEQENITDALTGMYNRRYLDRRLGEEYARFERYAVPLCIILVDLDEFKEINDVYGHQVGDLALNHVGKLIRKTIRTTDVVARYGGDEFMIITPNIHTGTAAVLAERIRQQVEKGPLLLSAGSFSRQGIPLTVSAGVVGCDYTGDTIQKLVQRVDEALYSAKEAGRNKVVVGDAKG